MQPHLIKQLISYPVVMDVAFIPQKEYYYHTSLSPSICSFLVEMPTDIWSGCNSLAGGWEKRVANTWGQWGTPHRVSSQSPWQTCSSGMAGEAGLEKPHFTTIQSISPSAANTRCSAHLDSPPPGTVAALQIQTCHWIIQIKETSF